MLHKILLSLVVVILMLQGASAQTFKDIQTIIPAYLPDSVFFAGERVPIEDEDVRARLQYEVESVTYFHSRTLLLIKRSGRWKKILQKVLEENQIHEDFFYLAVAESNLDPLIRSYASAVGMWQFLKGTGREFGLLINACTDERQDPLKAAVAACKYFKMAQQKFGTWTAAAASYNRGMNGILRAMDKQGTRNYYDLYLNSETARYVFRIIALKLVLENPSAYGYCLNHYDYFMPFEYDEVEVKGTIASVPEWAKNHDMTYKEFRAYNPGISIHGNSYSFTAPKEGYYFRVKKKKEEKVD